MYQKSSLKMVFIMALLVFGSILLCTVFATESQAETITVDDDGGADYTTIQDAVNESKEGDVIRVYEGLYVEKKLIINRTVSIVGNGTGATIIDGDENDDAVRITSPWVNMSNLAVTNSGDNDDDNDAGIFITAANVTIRHCVIRNNDNHGMYILNTANTTIVSCSVHSNSNDGIYFLNCNFNTIKDSTIRDNSYYQGIGMRDCNWNEITNITSMRNRYGFCLSLCNYNTLTNCTGSENTRNGLYIAGEHNLVQDCTFIHNENDGVFLLRDDHSFYRCNVSENGGSAFWMVNTGDYVDIRECIIENNTWTGISDRATKDLVVENCSIANNSGHGLDLGGYDKNYKALISNCSITNNGGWGISFDRVDGSRVTNTTIRKNEGGGISLSQSEDHTFVNLTVEENTGDGFYIKSDSDGNTILNSKIAKNAGNGVDIHDGSDYQMLENCVISDNTKTGINVYSESTHVSIENCTVAENQGYGIYVRDESDNCRAWYNNVYNNSAMGFYFQKSSNFEIVGCEFTGKALEMIGDTKGKYNSHKIENNTHNGNPIYYYRDKSDILVPEDAAQVIAAGCTKVTIRNITAVTGSSGILLAYCSDFIIENVTMKNNEDGTYLYQSSNIKFRSCNFTDNSNGLSVTGTSKQVSLSDTNFSANTIGILVEKNSYGIKLRNSSFVSNTAFAVSNKDNTENRVDAELCWWGNHSGPYHHSENSEGTGDNATDNVIFHPWIGHPKLVHNLDTRKDYHRIQDAIDAASPGDRLRVDADCYKERVLVNKTLTLIGNGSRDTTIDGEGEGSVVLITANHVNFSGFLVINSATSGSSAGIWITGNQVNVSDILSTGNRIGILVEDSSSGYIANSSCDDNYQGLNLVRTDNFTVWNNSFSRNEQEGINCKDSEHTLMSVALCHDNQVGILLVGSNFITISNSSFSGHSEWAVNLIDAHKNSLRFCHFQNNTKGVTLSQAHTNEISGCRVSQSSNNAISLTESNSNLILENFLDDDLGSAVLLFKSVRNNISGNIIKTNQSTGIHLGFDCHNNSILDNTIRSPEYCLFIQAENTTLHGNKLIIGFIKLEESFTVLATQTIGSSNTLNDKPVYYYVGEVNVTVPSNAGQVILVDCSDIEIEGLNLTSVRKGCSVFYTKGLYIHNCSISWSNDSAIYVLESSNITLYNNTFQKNVQVIYAKDSSNITIRNCSLSGFDYGVVLLDCEFLNVSGNQMVDGIGGFSVSGSQNIQFSSNRCEGLGRAVSLTNSLNIVLTANEILENDYGIFLHATKDILVLRNIIIDNDYGIYLQSSSSDCSAHNNTIARNVFYGVHASGNNGYRINATMNWWGSSTGPYHSTGNKYGKGDTVSDYVDFDPWIGNRTGPVQNLDKNTFYDDLQTAINDANPGDEILIHDGLLEEHIIIDRTLRIRGNSTEAATIRGKDGGNYPDLVPTMEVKAEGVILENLTIEGSGDDWTVGVHCSGKNITIVNCLFRELNIGVFVNGQKNITIQNTIFENLTDIFTPFYYPLSQDIVLENTSNCRITNNSFTENGLTIHGEKGEHWWSHTIEDNTLSGNKKLVYLKNSTTPLTLPINTGQVIIVNSWNITISGITFSSPYRAIQLAFSSNITITDSVFNFPSEGLFIYQSSDITMKKLTLSTPVFTGIRMENSHNCIIQDCYINIGEKGIWLQESSDNLILNSTINNMGDGILLERSCKDNNISQCKIAQNTRGVQLVDSLNTIILDCDFHDNDKGIVLDRANQTSIRKCYVLDGKGTGIIVHAWSLGISINNCDIDGNDGYGLRSYSSYMLNAENCYWGNKRGPTHSSNPDGVGEGISGNKVDFKPWLESTFTNKRPVAFMDSVSPTMVLWNSSVYFEGHGSDDEGITHYAWRSSIDGSLSTKSSFSTNELTPGKHMIFFKVRDGHGVWSDEVSVAVTVHTRPEARILKISPNPVLTTGTVQFEGVGVDDGSIQRYVWRSNFSGELHNGTTANFSQADFSKGVHTFFFRVQDEQGVWSQEVSAELEVHEEPRATIFSVSPAIALVGETVFLQGEGLDDDGLQAYEWSSDLDNILYTGAKANLSTSILSPGQHTISFRVQDKHGIWSKTVNTSLLIHEPPLATFISVTPNPAVADEDLFFNGTGVDDGSVATYNWRIVTGAGDDLSNGSTPPITLPPDSYIIYFMVQDNHGIWSEEIKTTLFVHVRPLVELPSIIPNPVLEGAETWFTATALDDGELIYYLWSSSLDGELYNGTEWSFSSSNLSLGDHTITLRVRDDHGAWSEPTTVTLEVKEDVPPVNILPTIIITSPQDNSELKGTVTIKGSASDEDGTVEKVDVLVDGEWFTATGITSWEFELDTTTLDNGEYVLKVLSYDGEDYSNDTLLSVTVNNKKKDDGGGGFLPGFGIELFVPALCISLLIQLRKRR